MARNILLIQDDPMGADVVRDALMNSSGGQFEVESITLCAEGVSRLARDAESLTSSVSAVLVDLYLPDCEGIETFERLFSVAPQIPFLVLSTVENEDTAKAAVQRGAQDYLFKERVDSYLLPKALSNMIERAAIAEALFIEKERAQVTLNSIGDAVLSTDIEGRVTYLNVVAERMTGWSREEAEGRRLGEVFRIVNTETRENSRDVMALAVASNATVCLAPDSVLIRRDGSESAIEDSAAPIHDGSGRVTGAVIVFHDVSAARAVALKMSYLAQHDALTDLPNRIMFQDRVQQAIAAAARNRSQFAVLYLDVDRFKHINDSHGHAVGDRLLCSVAQRLVGCVRASDTVSRQGGDEFVLLLSDLSQANAAAVAAEKIVVALRAPHRVDSRDLHVTASIGIATYPDDGADVDTLMKHADFAMYQAKDSGRDNYQFFLPAMNVSALERQAIAAELRLALLNGDFILHYQPKLNLVTGAIVGAEALIRWPHAQRGSVPPASFIPIAEESGLIVPIGRWVLREACAQTRAWQKAGLPPLRVAINISAVELRYHDFVGGVQAILTETGVDPSCIEFELTETFLMRDADATAKVLVAIKQLGIHIALDDFGTGYSSLSYLKRFPIDTLKIDQSFIRDIATDPDDASIVCAVISMGRSLHMRVVAEGVETVEQLAFLKQQVCPEGQGYYFSHPVEAAKFAQIVRRGVVQQHALA